MRKLLIVTTLAMGCDSPPNDWLAEIEPANGPLKLSIAYPRSARVGAGPLTVLGTTGNANTVLKVNGLTMAVAATGGFAAVVPDYADGRESHEIVAVLGRDTARATLIVSDIASNDIDLRPRSRIMASADQTVRLEIRAPRGAHAWVGTRFRALASSVETAGEERGEPGAAPELTIATKMQVLMSADSAYVARLADTVALGLPERHLADSHPIILEARSRIIVAVNNERTNKEPAIAVVSPSARLEAIEWHDDSVRVRLGGGATGWLPAAALRPSGPARRGNLPTPHPGVIATNHLNNRRVTRIYIATNGVPVIRVAETADTLTVRLMNIDGFGPFIGTRPEQTLEHLRLSAQLAPDRNELVLRVSLRTPIHGYEIEASGDGVVLVLRYPPRRVTDWRVLIDPGHPPRGAIGPAGTHEADVTLAVARRLQTILRTRGVHATLTRSNGEAVSLARRVSLVATERADIVVSLHADGVPDGVDPYDRDGTRSYYLHEHAKPLAQFLQSAVTRRLGTQDRGIRTRDLALTRPSGPAAVLCELATLATPEYEFLLSTSSFQRAAASALADGILLFISSVHPAALSK